MQTCDWALVKKEVVVGKINRIVPTEIDQNNYLINGYVHDENAFKLGGVAGHAGLFSTTNDLATFSQMMLNGGIYSWKRIFKPETVNIFTSRSNMNSRIEILLMFNWTCWMSATLARMCAKRRYHHYCDP